MATNMNNPKMVFFSEFRSIFSQTTFISSPAFFVVDDWQEVSDNRMFYPTGGNAR
jgi:hypothetical protein